MRLVDIRVEIKFLINLIFLVMSSLAFGSGRDLNALGEKGGAYLGSVAIAEHLKSTPCFNRWVLVNQWESLPQAFDEFSKVVITELVLQNPNSSRYEIEKIFNQERVKMERMVYKETEKFRNLEVSDRECRQDGPKIKAFMMDAYKQWKLAKDGSAWEFYANSGTQAPSATSASNVWGTGTSKPVPESAEVARAPTPARKPTMDDTLEGAQRIDFFKKLLDLGVITKEEFLQKRAEILATM